MNIEAFIYLSSVLPSIGGALTIITVSGLFILSGVAFFIIGQKDYNENGLDVLKKYRIFKIFFALVFCGFLSCFFPSQKTMYLMLGSHYLKDSNIPSKVELLLNKKLDEYLAEDKK